MEMILRATLTSSSSACAPAATAHAVDVRDELRAERQAVVSLAHTHHLSLSRLQRIIGGGSVGGRDA